MEALGASSVSLVALGWIHRVEVIQAPFYWHRVRALDALRASRPDDPAFRGTLNYGLSPFDVAVSKLIRVQRPEFLGGKRARLLPVMARGGNLAFLVSCYPLKVPFDREPDPDPVQKLLYLLNVTYVTYIEEVVAVLDRGSRVRGPRASSHLEPVRVWKSRFQILRQPEGFDIIRTGDTCAHADHEFSVDEDGLVSHGHVHCPPAEPPEGMNEPVAHENP